MLLYLDSVSKLRVQFVLADPRSSQRPLEIEDRSCQGSGMGYRCVSTRDHQAIHQGENVSKGSSRDGGQSGTTSFENDPAPPLAIDPGAFDQSTRAPSSRLSTFRWIRGVDRLVGGWRIVERSGGDDEDGDGGVGSGETVSRVASA